MGRADLHIHTREGDGLDSAQAILDHVEAQGELDVIALTEHDNLDVALRARDLWARGNYSFDFVPGVEVTTLQGHLVALYIEKPVPSLRRIEETVEAIKHQGGVCFVPHPASRLTRSLSATVIRRLAADDDLRPDALETSNAAPTGRFYLPAARRLATETGLPSVGASDAHFRQVVGSAYTEFEGRTAADLRAAFASGRLEGRQQRYPGLGEIGFLRSLAMPFAGLRATPKALGWRRTTWSFVSRYFA